MEIPSKFVNHILSLGFNKEDAPRLYEYKDDWIGINSGGSVRCTEKGCKFSTKHQSDALFKHCRSQHDWADYECDFLNCKFVAYSKTSLLKHKARFHSSHVRKHTEYRCERANCNASFKKPSDLKLHENIHDNNQVKCVFCPYTNPNTACLVKHQRVHFNIRDYKCEICGKSYYQLADLNKHFDEKHSGEITKCPLCQKEAPRYTIYDHLRKHHKLLGSSWDAENKIYILPDRKLK